MSFEVGIDLGTMDGSNPILTRLAHEMMLGMDLASNDSPWLDGAGITTVLLGPGGPEQAHTTDEELLVDQLHDAVAIYPNLAASMASNDQPPDESGVVSG